MQLIAHNEGTWTIGEKALEVLKRIKAPIAVVAVCGRARTGALLCNVLAVRVRRQTASV